MRYYYERPLVYSETKGETYICDHPFYNECTLYKKGDVGLAVIQQRFNPVDKSTMWGRLDPWLVDGLYFHPGFDGIFELVARRPVGGLYPTLTVRQLMYSLKIKPLKKEKWETSFDRKIL